MTLSRPFTQVTRRVAITGLAAGGASLALAATGGKSNAQDSDSDAMAGHPIVGTWLVMVTLAPDAPAVASPSLYGPDGYVTLAWPVSGITAAGVSFSSTWVGSWEPVDEQTVHVTAVQALSDANGVFTGTATVDGHPRVSADGATFIDDAPDSVIMIRDPFGAVVAEIKGGPPVTATRIGVGSVVFSAGT